MRKVTAWDFFEDAISSKAEKIRELNRKYVQEPVTNFSANLWGMTPEQVESGAAAIEPYLGIGPGILGGPSTVMAKIRSNENYAKQMRKWKDTFTNIRKDKPNLFDEVNKNMPGLHGGDIFFLPETAKMYKETDTLFMPYLMRDPVTGVNKFVPMLDLGEVAYDPMLRNIAMEKLTEGKKVPFSDFAALTRGKWAEEAFPKWGQHTALRLTDDVGKQAISPIGSGSLRYDPFRRDRGLVTFNRPEIFTAQHRGLFDEILNHELQHMQSSLSGVAAGTSPNAYWKMPVGYTMKDLTPDGIYRTNLDEVLARAAETYPKTNNTLASIQSQLVPGDETLRFGTQYPVVIKEQLKHPNFGESYRIAEDHFGMDAVDYLARMGFEWLWK